MSMNRAEKHQQETRQAFIFATLQLIMEKGYDNVTVADIVRVADYGRSTFYLHFKDKEDVVWAMLLHHMTLLDEQIRDNVAHLPSPLREWRAWYMIFADIERQRPFFLQADGKFARQLRQMQKDQLITTFTQQLRDGEYSILQDVPPEIGARFVVGALLELLDYWLIHPEAGDPRTMANYMFQLIFREPPPTVE